MGWLDILDVRRTIVASVSNTQCGLEIENIAKWLGQYPTQEGFWSIKPNIQPFLEDLVHSRIYIVTWVHMYCRIFTKNQGCCCLSYTIEEDRPKDNMQICCFIVTIHLHTIVHLYFLYALFSLVIWRARFLKHLHRLLAVYR